MATELSCLTDVDEDDKDADPKINALELLQEPVRMAQESASCADSFGKPSMKQNNVLDVLSNTDMLSPVGLGNGPSSHQATQAHELNSISTEKEEAKSITPLKTVQEIDTAGIWDFDADSPENSLDNFDNASDIHWDAHKEFMQFLWENHDDSPGEELKDEVLPANSQRRRKRKMDMVVMVDPSEDLYPDLSRKSSEDLTDAEGQADSIPVRKARKKRRFSKSQSPPTVKVPQYPNGTVKAIKEILCNGPPRNSLENSIGHRALPLKRRLTMNSHSKGRPSCYPCSNCKLVFKKEHHLHRHMKSHADLTTISPKPFICQECGQFFRQNSLLIEHMSNQHEKRDRLAEDIKGISDKKKEDKNKKLFCPQCPFGTNCPNKFVQHAKTHEKDKRKFSCDKCSFRTLSENDLRKHEIMQHTVITVRKQVQNDHSENYSCNICSYRAFSKTVFKNHLLRRHQLTLEEHEAEQIIEQIAQTTKEQYMHADKTPVEDAELTSKMTIKNQISKRSCSPGESSEISDLFKNNKIKKSLKSQLMESKLDKSINVLLSRQRHGKKFLEQNKGSNNGSTLVQDPKTEDGYHQLSSKLSVQNKESALSPDDAATSNLPNDIAPKLTKDQSLLKKSPSKRKMSTPYRNTSDQDSCFILSKPLPSPKKINQEEDYAENCISFDDADVNASFFKNGIKKENQNIYTYSRRMSMRGALQASKRLFEKIKTEEREQNDLEIKEEDIESEVDKTFDSFQIPLSDSFAKDMSEEESERKNCPYCPAVFDSGVGLSNHVRGHLHRAGLNYNARHVVSPEQVASQDRRPRIRRKISSFRRFKKALQVESDSEDTVQSIHSCPLCGDSFDNRTGQSNHIRGHLKKLGKSFATKSKTPLMLLRELMRDKKELQRAFQILGKRQNHFQYGASPKLRTADCFTSQAIGVQNNSNSSVCTEVRPLMPMLSLTEVESEREQHETKLGVKNSLSGTTALIGILKKRKCQEDARLKASSHMSRNALVVSSNSEHSSGSKVASSLPKLISEKGEFNRKVCVHCNATFHSGVSLSNHLRAYAKRKRNALLEGTSVFCLYAELTKCRMAECLSQTFYTSDDHGQGFSCSLNSQVIHVLSRPYFIPTWQAFDCKARRHRSRPGPKKKTLPLPQTPEEMYRLTCRFCDLVFQGPLSVQEDWIKHLQRHIMNTSVPHTGLGMVEVTSLSTTLKTDQDSSLTATHAAS